MTQIHKTVFVSGNFYALHPGHVRLLRFAAECGERLIVGVTNSVPDPRFPSPQERVEALRELGFVSSVIVVDRPLPDLLDELRPDIVVKGKEFESRENIEEAVLAGYGGKLLFSSGESTYSARELLTRDTANDPRPVLAFPELFARRHRCRGADLRPIVARFAQLKVVVIGDFIADEYIDCDVLGLSREDATLVVSPQSNDRFIGGAGIVAAHARMMGADVRFVTVLGADEPAQRAKAEFQRLGVNATCIGDDSRPTTLKQRFRALGKTVLRVSHLRQHEIGREVRERVLAAALPALEDADLLILSDFNYGVLPQPVVDELCAAAAARGIPVAADSQSSSQVGDISRYRGAALLTPTEHEARLALRDQTSGLAKIGHDLIERTESSAAFITLGADGILVVTPPETGVDGTDRLPAFNHQPVDVAGAGDSMLVAGSMALAAGATPWQAGFLGSIAAGIQAGRVGNIPISAAELQNELR